VRHVTSVVVAALFLAVPANPACLSILEVQRENSYFFALALVESFSYAQTALDRAPEKQTADPTDLIAATRQASLDFDCAARLVEPYKSSADETIKTGAEAAHLAYSMFIKLNDDLLDLYKKALNGETAGRMGDLSDRLAQNRVLRDESWRALPLAVAAATHALVELPSDPNQKLSTLKITATQRGKLKTKLREIFGEQITHGPKAGQIPLTASGALMYEFLNTPGWKTRK
jgi:hypothetical protein